MSWCATYVEKGEQLKTNIKVPPVLGQDYKKKSNKLLSQAGLLAHKFEGFPNVI